MFSWLTDEKYAQCWIQCSSFPNVFYARAYQILTIYASISIGCKYRYRIIYASIGIGCKYRYRIIYASIGIGCSCLQEILHSGFGYSGQSEDSDRKQISIYNKLSKAMKSVHNETYIHRLSLMRRGKVSSLSSLTGPYIIVLTWHPPLRYGIENFLSWRKLFKDRKHFPCGAN